MVSDPLSEGIFHFNHGQYFDAHESWEDLWREARGQRRVYCQGLVQVAVGLYHLSKGNRAGGRRVLMRGIQKLEDSRDAPDQIDNNRLISDLKSYLDSGAAEPVEIHAPRNGRESGEQKGL